MRRHCPADDAELLKEVEELLDAEQRADAFMSRMEASANRLTSEPFEAGNVVGNYRIERKLGSGGMGTVYRAFDLRLNRSVALKFLHPHRAASERDEARFLREARAASRIDHENICTIFEISRTQTGLSYIAMAFCEGRSLDAIVAEEGVAPLEAVLICKRLAGALAQAHLSGIFHRDLKPANVIVDGELQPKLVDFGIAKILDDDTTATSSGFGTAAYMAPEQFGKGPVDGRADIWSVGCMLYEMLTGRRPFPGDSPAEVVYNVLNHEIPRPCALRPELPIRLDDIVGRCLARERDERFNSPQELADALESTQATVESLALASPSRVADTGPVERRRVTALCYRCQSESAAAGRLPGLVSHVCRQHEGFLLHAGEDGGAVLLGYLAADEHAASKAVRCGLQLLTEAREAGCGIALGADAGVMLSDTGRPVDTDRLSNEPLLHSAARLCEAAEAGTMLVNDRLRLLVQDDFELRPLANAFEVRQERASNGRAWDGGGAAATPLSGRVHELGMLEDAWERVLEGDGQVISVSGEPGIGKSRMVYELKRTLGQRAAYRLIECQCAPYQRHTALYPVVAHLEAELGWSSSADTNAKRMRTKALADELGLSAEKRSLLEHLLKVRSAAPRMSGEAMRHETLLLIEEILLHPCRRGPVALIFEDLHWADPTTIDLLNLLVEKGPVANLLLLCTYRPSFQPRWHGRAYIANLSLNRLGKRHAERMAGSLVGGRDLSPELLQSIVRRTDGVPLFIEELMHAVVEQLHGQQEGDPDGVIPLTLQDSLQSRLDALGVAKHLAQLGAVIGREFPHSLLRAVAKALTEPEFEKQLKALVRSQLVQQLGAPPQGGYRFKHALIRDAAYQSLTEDTRRDVHLAVATAYEEALPEAAARQPEVLAHHFSGARQSRRAAQCWLQAGQAALESFAVIEAASHCRAGLREVVALQSTPETLQLELALQTTLGPALMATQGYADPDVNAAYSRAREICRTLGDPPAVFPVLFGLWTFHCVRALHPAAAELAQQMVDIAAAADDPELGVEGHMSRGITRFFRGRFPEAREDFSYAASLFEADMTQRHIVEYGQDPSMVILAYEALNDWILGAAEEADLKALQAVDRGRRSEHPFSLAYALSFAAWHFMNRADIETARRFLDEAISLCESNRIRIFLVMARVLESIAQVDPGELESGIAQIEQALGGFTSTGASLFMPSWHAVLARHYGAAGAADRALEEVAKARAASRSSTERWCLADIECAAGDVAAMSGCGADPAERYAAALEIAAHQHAAAWQARARAAIQATAGAARTPQQRPASEVDT